jgi:hypothetical protein
MARVRSVAARHRREWSEYYRAAMTGMLAAHTRQPNQQIVARGRPRECGELWTLRKGKRVASCRLWTNPLGGEVRVEVDGEMIRTQADRDGLALVNLGLEWRQQFETKGWLP